MNKIVLITIVFITGMLLFSCNSSKYIYFYEDKDYREDTNYYNLTKPEYRLAVDDILDIQFHSTMTDVEQMFRFQQGTTSREGASSAFFRGYQINDSGYIRMPVIGYIRMEGLTLKEAQQAIENEAKKYVNDIIVKARLYGIKVTFVGEFGGTGEKYFYKNNVHLLEALSIVNVLNTAKIKEIRLIRQTQEGFMTYRIDLTDRELVQSDIFYLQPNDILYAEPRPLELFRRGWADYSFLLSTVTSTLTLIILLATLNK